jgi:hypothetical protein
MAVDVQTCSITWKRNGAVVKAQQQFKQLQETSIKWVPYICLNSYGGVSVSVSLLEEILGSMIICLSFI